MSLSLSLLLSARANSGQAHAHATTDWVDTCVFVCRLANYFVFSAIGINEKPSTQARRAHRMAHNIYVLFVCRCCCCYSLLYFLLLFLVCALVAYFLFYLFLFCLHFGWQFFFFFAWAVIRWTQAKVLATLSHSMLSVDWLRRSEREGMKERERERAFKGSIAKFYSQNEIELTPDWPSLSRIIKTLWTR